MMCKVMLLVQNIPNDEAVTLRALQNNRMIDDVIASIQNYGEGVNSYMGRSFERVLEFVRDVR
jgi:hypothetical protein